MRGPYFLASPADFRFLAGGPQCRPLRLLVQGKAWAAHFFAEQFFDLFLRSLARSAHPHRIVLQAPMTATEPWQALMDLAGGPSRWRSSQHWFGLTVGDSSLNHGFQQAVPWTNQKGGGDARLFVAPAWRQTCPRPM